MPYLGDWEGVVAAIREFAEPICLESARPYDSVLATVLFTDIVASTAYASELGDYRWHQVLDEHNELVREEVSNWQGNVIKALGDGFLATFDGPARAVRCAESIIGRVKPLGIDVRTGVHTGECERLGDDIGGIAVHTAARIAALAGPGEVLVSSTVRDLVAGSRLPFVDRGTHALKGVPETWNLFALER